MNDYLRRNPNTNADSETRLMHCLCKKYKTGNYTCIDYQIPTTNGTRNNIDILLKKDDNLYMVEAKTFGSNESLLRCVLEIQTYYMKLNERFYDKYCSGNKELLKKAVLFDTDSFAYKQLKEDWAKKLLLKFDIIVLKLQRNNENFYIEEVILK